MVWTNIWQSRSELLLGLRATLLLVAFSLPTSTVLGIALGTLRARGPLALQAILRVYIEIFRGSPLLVQLLIIYFGSAYMGFNGLTTLTATIIGLTLYEGAYITEIVRAGLRSVPPGQDEASRTLGLTALQRLRLVSLPQAFRVIMPALIGQWIALIKDSALSSVIGYHDLMLSAQSVYSSNGHPFEVLLVISAVYFVLCSPLTLVTRQLERRRSR